MSALLGLYHRALFEHHMSVAQRHTHAAIRAHGRLRLDTADARQRAAYARIDRARAHAARLDRIQGNR